MKLILKAIAMIAIISGCADSSSMSQAQKNLERTAMKSIPLPKKLPTPDSLVLYKTIDNVELKLHFFLPQTELSNKKLPAIIFYFGGGWNGGNPNQFYRQSHYLASRGMVAIAAEYRVKNRNQTTPIEAVIDAKSAIRWLKKNASTYNIDPNQIIAAGASAGGHLAAATATVTRFNDPSDDLSIDSTPSALALFNPVYDNSKAGYSYGRVKEYWQDFSPLHNLTKRVPPTVVFLGEKDHLIPVATAKKFKQKMEALGIRSDLYLYENQKHGFFNYQHKKYFLDTLYRLDMFLTSLGYLKGAPTFEPNNMLKQLTNK